MHSKSSWESSHYLAISLILFILTCSGCARKPWTTTLDDNQAENIVHFLQQLNHKAELCPESIDGDISLSYQNIFDKKNVRGYFQLLSPSFIKLIISNPFGQPVFMMTSDQHTFQLIDTFERRYVTGNVSAYGMIHNIPPALLRGDWQNWLQGKVSIDINNILTIRNSING